MAHAGEALAGGVCQHFNQMPEYIVKDHARKVLRDLLLVAASLVESSIQEGGVGPVAEDERVAAEEKIEDAKSVLVPGPQYLAEIGLEVRR